MVIDCWLAVICSAGSSSEGKSGYEDDDEDDNNDCKFTNIQNLKISQMLRKFYTQLGRASTTSKGR